jgi:hypothetical protein
MHSIYSFLFILLTLNIQNCNSNSVAEKNDLVKSQSDKIDFSNDLKQFDGFFSHVESDEFEINKEKIPASIRNLRGENISKVNLLYLNKVGNCYVINLGLNFETLKFQMIGTLDEHYILQDFRYFPDGYINKFSKSDTICLPTYNIKTITVELMHPNENEEPDFEVDGIEKHVLVISEDMSLSEE